MLPRNYCMRYLIQAVVLIASDQLIKFCVRATQQPGESISVIGDFFQITLIKNEGAAFGIMSGQALFLIAVPAAVIIGAIWYMVRHRELSRSFKTALTLIISGGIGNLIDRLMFGQVTDMFSFSVFPPVFNLADVFVTLGCVLLILNILFDGTSRKKRS